MFNLFRFSLGVILGILLCAILIGLFTPRPSPAIPMQSVVSDLPQSTVLTATLPTPTKSKLADGALPVKKTTSTSCTCPCCGSPNCTCADGKCSCLDCGCKDCPCDCAKSKGTVNGVQVCPDGCKCKCSSGDCTCSTPGACGDPACQCGYGARTTASKPTSKSAGHSTDLAWCVNKAKADNKPLVMWINEACIPCEQKMATYIHCHLTHYEDKDGDYTGPGVIIGKPNPTGGVDYVQRFEGIPTVEAIEDSLNNWPRQFAQSAALPAPTSQLPIFRPMLMPMMPMGGFGGFGGGFGGGMMMGGGGGGC